MNEVTRILEQIQRGDLSAAARLMPLVYDELRQLAAAQLAGERPGQTLDATALVHEAYVRLIGDRQFADHRHFFRVAAEAMRRILIDRARRKRRIRHGGDRQRVPLSDVEIAVETPVEQLLALDEALDRFAAMAPAEKAANAQAQKRLRQLDKSIPLFEETLKRQEAKLGRDHPDTQRTVGNLGMNYKDAGRLKEAIPLLEEAYRAAKKYPSLRFVGPLLLDAYAKAGEKAKFAALLPEQLAEARKSCLKDSPQLAGALAQISLALLEHKKWAEAETLLRECLAIRTKTRPDGWLTFNTKSMLGGAFLGLKKYAAAEPLLQASYQGMKKREAKIPPQGKLRLTEAVERLVQLYEATGKKDEAAKWRKELTACKPQSPPK